MTTKTDDIKLPELPVGFFKHHIAGFDDPVYAEMQMDAYARAAVEADRQRRMPSDDEISELWSECTINHATHHGKADTLIRLFAETLLSRYGSQPVTTAPSDESINGLWRECSRTWIKGKTETPLVQQFARDLLSRYGSSQPAISNSRLQCILQVYDDALDKAREGREFDNPGRPGSLEARAWDAGTRRGKELGPITQPAKIPAEGQEISIDVSTGDHDAGRRAFGKLTGEVNPSAHGDVWLAEGYINEPATSAEPTSGVCAACGGSGEDQQGYQQPGPNGDCIDGPCRECGGSGVVPVAQEPVAYLIRGKQQHDQFRMDLAQAKACKRLRDKDFDGEDQTAIVPLYAAPVAVQSQPSAQDREDASTLDWMTDDNRAPWAINSLKDRIKEMRASEKRCRNAFRKDYMRMVSVYFADALDEAAEAFEKRLAAIDAARAAKEQR